MRNTDVEKLVTSLKLYVGYEFLKAYQLVGYMCMKLAEKEIEVHNLKILQIVIQVPICYTDINLDALGKETTNLINYLALNGSSPNVVFEIQKELM